MVSTSPPLSALALAAVLRRDWLLAPSSTSLHHDHDHDLVSLQLVCRAWRDVVAAVTLADRTLLVTHPLCAAHHIPRRSDRPERLRVVLARCAQRFPRQRCHDQFTVATVNQLVRFHTDMHVDTLHRLGAKIERSMAALDALTLSPVAALISATESGAGSGGSRTKPAPGKRQGQGQSRAAYYAQFEYIDLDEDTVMMRHSLNASLAAAGAVCHAVDLVLATATATAKATVIATATPTDPLHASPTTKTATKASPPPRNAFCVVRPPGHHAEPQRAMGFCLFNNIGVGAWHALEVHGLTRVAIVDFDVHHGNGTQRRAEQDPRVLYVSMHQAPLFPHTGHRHEQGAYGNVLNLPLPARTSAASYVAMFRRHVLPRVEAFAPQLLLLSAGFDGHELDPLSDMKLRASDYYELTRELTQLAWRCRSCQGRIVSVLEGGYHTRALADSAEQHVRALAHGAYPFHVSVPESGSGVGSGSGSNANCHGDSPP